MKESPHIRVSLSIVKPLHKIPPLIKNVYYYARELNNTKVARKIACKHPKHKNTFLFNCHPNNYSISNFVFSLPLDRKLPKVCNINAIEGQVRYLMKLQPLDEIHYSKKTAHSRKRKGYDQLIQQLKSIKNLKGIIVDLENPLTEQNKILRIIKNNVKTITLCHLSKSIIEYWSTTLPNCVSNQIVRMPKLQRLSIDKYKMTHSQLEKALERKNLITLNLSDSIISHSNSIRASFIPEYIPINTNYLAKQANLKHITLSGCYLEGFDAEDLAEFLKNNKFLKFLNLSNNGTSAGIVGRWSLIFSSLHKKTCLQYLNLSLCALNDRDTKALAEFLKVNNSLQFLILAHMLTQTNASGIVDALARSKTIKHLHLRASQLSIDHLLKILSNKNLAVIDLNDSTIPNLHLHLSNIWDALQGNKDLIKFKLPFTGIGPNFDPILKRFLKKNQHNNKIIDTRASSFRSIIQ